MATINDAKEAALSLQPLLLYDFSWPDGTTLSVCSHAVTFNGVPYGARVIGQQFDPIQVMSATGIVVPVAVRVTFADADKDVWGIEASKGFRGARVKVTFAYYDFRAGIFSTDSIVPFIGRCAEPEVRDDVQAVSASYILNLAAKNLPGFPIQPRCPKLFPFTADMKALAGTIGSPYYACGVIDPTKVTCDFTPVGCAGNGNSPRFGGVEYQVPPGSHTREYKGGWQDLISSQDTRYGDYVPIGYGTAWVDCKTLGTWPEANSTRGEAIVCEGRPRRILKVTVEDEELPASNDLDYNSYSVADALFRYDVVSNGDRTGRLNPDHPWNGAGDPHGSVCVIEWVVYHKVTSGTPRVRALVEFADVHAYARIDTIAAGVATLAANRPNRDIGGGSVRVFGCANAALNGTWPVTSATWGPPGTVTLGGGAAGLSGAGGWIEFDIRSDRTAWAVRDLLERAGEQLADQDLEAYAASHERFEALVSYTARYSNQYASGVTYDSGEVATYAGVNYVSLQSGNTGNQPDTSPDWWSVTDAAPAAQPTGVTMQHAQYRCSLVISERRTAEDVISGLLRSCTSHLRVNLTTGQRGLCARGSVAEQQPAAMDGSNYNVAVNGGYVAYRFSESSMVRRADGMSTFRRVARAAAEACNSVTIGFANEDNDYSGDSARVVDTDDVNLMGQEIVGQWKVDGCNSLDRANRAGSIFLATQLEGKLYEWDTTAKAIKVSAGDIIAFDNAKHGFDLQLARVMEIRPQENWKLATVRVALHDDAWYAADYQRGPASGAVAPQRSAAARPPRVWAPDEVAPAAGDPLYAATEKTFGLGLTYELMENGTPQPAIVVKGRAPVSQPANLQPPVVKSQGFTANAGGTIPGDGAVYYAVVCSTDAAGLPGAVSNVCQIVVAQAGSTNTITIPVSYLDPAGSGWAVYVGRNAARMTKQAAGAGSTAAITLTAYLETDEGAPDPQIAAIVARPRRVRHYGRWAQQVNVVGAGTLQFTGAGWPAHQWQGCDCTVLARADGSDLGVLNFHVTDSTADTLTVTPDPAAAGIVAGDLVAMLGIETIAGFKLTDARWMNTLSGGGAGLAAGAEKGAVWRILAGAGRGYRYPIVDNDATSITVQGPWVVTPDGTSRGIIEEAGTLEPVAAAVANDDPAALVQVSVPVANYAGKVLLLEAIARDAAGRESAGALNPVRCVYVPGAQGTRTITASDTQLATDGLVLCDTSGVAQPAATTLAAAVATTTQTSISLTDGSHTVNGTDILIGSERMRIQSGGGTGSLVVSRGAAGTTAATHSNGDAVTVPGGLTFTCLASADVRNVKLAVKKTTSDINYVVVLAGGSDTFDSGATSIILADDTDASGMAYVQFPG